MAQDSESPAVPTDPAALIAEIERLRASGEPHAAAQERISYLGFLLEGELYGVRLDQLREVAPLGRLRRLPSAPPGVAGLVNLRGEILCALDARALLGLPPTREATPAFLVVLRGFEDPLALVVDAVADIYSIDPDEIEPTPPTWPAERAARFVGTVRVGNTVMGLLDLAKVLAP